MADSATAQKSDFLFLMRGADWGNRLSPREAQEGLTAMIAWLDNMKDQGLLRTGQPLAPQGSVVSATSDSVIDGPFIESKEAVGGYMFIQASSFEEAQKAAMACPVLKYGLVIEVRPIVGECQSQEPGSDGMAKYK